MKKFKIKWINTGRIETLEGYDLYHAFVRAGLQIWYKKTEIWQEL